MEPLAECDVIFWPTSLWIHLSPLPKKCCITVRSLTLFDRRQTLPYNPDHNELRCANKRQLKRSLRGDREALWSQSALEMETAVLAGNTRRLWQSIRSSGHKKSGVSEVIREADGTQITNLQRHMDRWAAHFQFQFSSSPSSIFVLSSPCSAPWAVLHESVVFVKRK
ncbi:unnamed protein product [Dicrocoelium dendriticum]|nr:unnamed protein product [Dicrocoelium dendriticum]